MHIRATNWSDVNPAFVNPNLISSAYRTGKSPCAYNRLKSISYGKKKAEPGRHSFFFVSHWKFRLIMGGRALSGVNILLTSSGMSKSVQSRLPLNHS